VVLNKKIFLNSSSINKDDFIKICLSPNNKLIPDLCDKLPGKSVWLPADRAFIVDILRKIQNDLFDLGADLSTPIEENPKFEPLRIKNSQVLNLENMIDKFNNKLEPLNSFVLPGGSEMSCWLHIARTVARRAERSISKLAEKNKINKQSLIYINRLSDFLFVVSRVTNDNGKFDILWVPGENQ